MFLNNLFKYLFLFFQPSFVILLFFTQFFLLLPEVFYMEDKIKYLNNVKKLKLIAMIQRVINVKMETE